MAKGDFGLLPKFTLMSVGEYLMFAVGATVAFSFLTPMYANIENNMRKDGGN